MNESVDYLAEIGVSGKGYILRAREAARAMPLATREVVEQELDNIERLIEKTQREGDEELLDEIQLYMLQVEKRFILTKSKD